MEKSKTFYSQLRYTLIPDDKHLLYGDSQCILEINPDPYARCGIKFFKNAWPENIDKVKSNSKVFNIEGGFVLADPNNVPLYFMESEQEFELLEEEKCLCGNYRGLSIESFNIEKAIAFWEELGFSPSMGNVDQGWIALTNKENFSISLLSGQSCPHLFSNPSLNYFNGKDNLGIIEKIKKRKIPIREEITFFNKKKIVDNIIIQDPGGLGFFLFSD